VEHAEISNRTPFHGELLHLEDENGLFVCCVVIKGTYDITDKTALVIAEQQVPINYAGEYWSDAPESSYKYEPEIAFVKLATDIVLIGEAYAPRVGTQVVDVGIKVGPVQKVVRVFGDRYWVKTGGAIIATRPQPFERIPLVYERAFGGWDKAGKDEKTWRSEARNPVGKGFGDPLRYVEEGRVAMPNLEDLNQPLNRYGESPPPAGFGFVSPHWQPRARYGGTFDAAWDKERKPLLPKDFDRRFFSAASPGLVAQGYLQGNEEVVVVNASPQAQLRFRLPGVPAPACDVELRGGRSVSLQTNLDTVIVNVAERRVLLLWRSFLNVKNGPFDVVAADIVASNTGAAGRN
jgi:hypothetical protein